ncbi:hypothetical protein bcgnr5378_07020 [Bacillus cereus]|uniref:Uncharacterized protein n=1 Tax=Bacillus cereus TaxID=1396 RepID=A0A164NX64_BACCE|nr:hypothetical protein [Bacillus cereus]KZD65958.1 hypothetical protein B4088_2715 [Bacillus cereus]
MRKQLFLSPYPFDGNFYPVKNTDSVSQKPRGGLWTSTYNETEGSSWYKFASHIRHFEVGEPLYATLFTVKEDANIYVVDSYGDLEKLMETYGIPVEESFPSFGSSDPLSYTLDFEKMAETYDGFHLTEDGLFAVRGTVSLFTNRKYSLTFYDVECTVWLKPSFEKCEELGHTVYQKRMTWDQYKKALSVNE